LTEKNVSVSLFVVLAQLLLECAALFLISYFRASVFVSSS
jgi:hypothetical protein